MVPVPTATMSVPASESASASGIITAKGVASASAAAAPQPAATALAGMTNTLARLHGAQDMRMETAPVPKPRAGEAVVRVVATGTCGSDLHYYLHGRNGNFELQHPMCLGHESAGVVVALPEPDSNTAGNTAQPLAAADGTPLRVGDRVAIEAGLPCRGRGLEAGATCERCAEGRYNLCPRMRFASSAKTHPHLDGTLQTFLTWPAWSLHRIPDNVSLLSASLIEPLSVVLQGFQRAHFTPAGPHGVRAAQAAQQVANGGANSSSSGVNGHASSASSAPAPPAPAPHYGSPDKSVLIIGAGAVGLLACAAAKALGGAAHTYVAAVDIDAPKLAFAKHMHWADDTFCLPRTAPQPQQANGSAEHADDKARRKAEDDASVARAQAQAADLLSHLSSSSSGSSSGGVAAPAGLAPPGGFDLVLECTGVPSCVQMGIFATRPGGRVVLIGMGHPVQSAFPIGGAALREVDIVGVFRYANVYPLAIDLLSSGRIAQVADGSKGLGGIENLVSHRYKLADAKQAFETMRAGKSADGTAVLKVFVTDDEALGKDDEIRGASA